MGIFQAQPDDMAIADVYGSTPFASSSCGTAVATALSHSRWSLMSMKGSCSAWLISRPRKPEQSTNRSASRASPPLVCSVVTYPRESCSTRTISSWTWFTPCFSVAKRRRKSATSWASKCQAYRVAGRPSSQRGAFIASITGGSRKQA